MAQRRKPTKFTDGDKGKYWHVANLNPTRPTRRTCSRNRWISLVNALIERDADGNLVHREDSLIEPSGQLVIRVGTPDWKAFLRSYIQSTGYRMCWEPPRPPVRREPDPSLFD